MKKNFESVEVLADKVISDIRMFSKLNSLRAKDDLDPIKNIAMRLNKGSLAVIGGRHSSGKTTLITQLLSYKRSISNILTFTLGQSEELFIKHYISHKFDFPFSKLHPGIITRDEFSYLKSSASKNSDSNFFINSELDLAPQEVFESCKKMIHKKGKKIDFIIIDGVTQDYSYRYKDTLAFYFKKIAVQFNVLVLITSDVSYEVDIRPHVSPLIRDLDALNSLSSVAENIIFVSRNGLYQSDFESNFVEVIEAKKPDGEITHNLCSFDGIRIGFFD